MFSVAKILITSRYKNLQYDFVLFSSEILNCFILLIFKCIFSVWCDNVKQRLSHAVSRVFWLDFMIKIQEQNI